MSQLDETTLIHGVRYFPEEMPLLMDSASIVSARSSVFCYHQCPAVLERLYKDRTLDLVNDTQGFLVVANAGQETS